MLINDYWVILPLKMTNKKFAGQVTLLLLVNVVVKLIWIFFIERKVQLSVGFAAYGAYYSIFNYTLILTVINDPGLNNYLIRYLSKGESSLNEVSAIFYIKIMLSSLYLIVTLTGAFLLGFKDYSIVFLLILCQLGFSFLTYLRGFLKGYQLLKTDVIFSVLDKSILITAFIPLLYLHKEFIWTIKFYAISQLCAVIISLLLCAYYLYHKKIAVFIKGHISFNFQVLKSVLPFAVFAFLVLAYNRIDTIMLEKILPNGAFEAGIYVAAYRFLDAATMLSILFASFLYPVLSKMIGYKKQVEELIENSLVFLLNISLVLAIASWFYRSQLMEMFYGDKSNDNLALIFGVLMFCLPLVTLYYLYSTLFTANNSLKVLNVVSGFGLLLNVILNLILIPKFQAIGAAFSSAITFFIIGLTYMILYYKYLGYYFYPLIWFKILLFMVLLIALGYLISYLPIHWFVGFTCYLMVAFVIGAILRFFNVRMLRSIIS